MSHDIFISYSRKDRESADQLTELLASRGLSVWIDRQGIAGVEKWATEIVEGIKGCATFILLISAHSVQSENVLRELSIFLHVSACRIAACKNFGLRQDHTCA